MLKYGVAGVVVLSSLLATTFGHAEELPTVAMMDFKAKAGISQQVVDALADLIASAVQGIGEYRVVGRSDIESMIGFEKIKDRLGCDETACLSEIGGALGVRYIITGNTTRLGEVWLVNLSLIDPQRSVVANRVSRKVEGGEAVLIDELPNAVHELFGKKPVPRPPADKANSQAPQVAPPPQAQALVPAENTTRGDFAAPVPDLIAAERLLDRDLQATYSMFLESRERRNGINFHDYLLREARSTRSTGRGLLIGGGAATAIGLAGVFLLVKTDAPVLLGAEMAGLGGGIGLGLLLSGALILGGSAGDVEKLESASPPAPTPQANPNGEIESYNLGPSRKPRLIGWSFVF